MSTRSVTKYKIAIVILLAGIVSSSGTAAYFYQQKTGQVLQTANANSEIADLNNQIASYKTQILNLNAKVTLLNSQIAQLQSQVQQLNTQITSLNNQAASDKNQINALNAQVSSLNSQIAQLQSQVQQLQSNIDSLNSQIDSLNKQIANLNQILNLSNSKTQTSTASWDLNLLAQCMIPVSPGSFTHFDRCFSIDISGIGSIQYSGYIHITWSTDHNQRLNFWLSAGGSPTVINPPTTSPSTDQSTANGDYTVPVAGSPTTPSTPSAAFVFDYYCGLGDCPGGSVTYTVSYVY